MKKITLSVLSLLFATIAVFAQEGNLQNLYVSRIIIGSDSTAVFVRQGTLNLKDGKAGIKNVSDVEGGIRVESNGNEVKSIIMRQDSTYSSDVNFESYYEMVRSNIGKAVEIEVRENQSTTGYEGFISDYGINPSFFMLNTSYGTQSIAFDKIENLGFNENIINKSRSIKSYPVAEIEFTNKVEKQQTTLSYLKKGLWWEPVYSYTYLEGVDGKLELQALIGNTGEDVYNTDIYLTGKATERNAFLYGKRGVSLTSGSKTLLPIFSVACNKKDVLRIMVNPCKFGELKNVCIDTVLSEMHCEIINQSEYDWAKGNIRVFDEFSASLGTSVLPETPAGSRTVIVAGQNTSVYAIITENRTRKFVLFKSSSERDYKVSGTIKIINNSVHPETLEIVQMIDGRLKEPKEGNFKITNNEITWKCKLSAEESVLLKYKYKSSSL